MMILICLAGILIGAFCGLVPGMHINTLLPLMIFLGNSLKLSSYELCVLLVSTAVTEIFVNFISSIFIGAPEEGTSLSVLPGHRLLLEGRGYEAIKLTVIGGIFGLILTLSLIFSISQAFKVLYKVSRPFIHLVIIFFVIFMLASERNVRKILAATLIFFLSGLLGLICLYSSINQQNILFPILTGFFGLPTLLISVSECVRIPPQDYKGEIKISKKEIIKSVFLGSISGLIVGFLPAIGISEAATFVSLLSGLKDARNFLITISGINIGNEVFSLMSLFLVGNPRSGVSVAIQRILGRISLTETFLLIGAICFSSGIAALLTLFLGKKIPKYLERINYKLLCSLTIIFIILAIFLLTGPLGLLIVFTSTSIGLLCNYLKVKRSHCMGCLILPSILFFSGLVQEAIIFLKI